MQRVVRRRRRRRPNNNIPAAVGSSVVSRSANTSLSGAGFRVQHREFVTSLQTPTGTSLTYTFLCNPAIPYNATESGHLQPTGLFTWLVSVAQNYQKYKINSLSLEFVPSAPTTIAGNITAGIDYNVDNPDNGITLQELTSLSEAVQSAYWTSFSLHAKPQPSNTPGPKFIRNFAVAGSKVTYDAFLFYVTLSQTSTSQLIGNLWVTYDITFMSPQPPNVELRSPSAAVFLGEAQIIESGNPTDLIAVADNKNSLGVYVDDASFTLPRGVYRVSVLATGSTDSKVADLLTASMQLSLGGEVLSQGAVASTATGTSLLLTSEAVLIVNSTAIFTASYTLEDTLAANLSVVSQFLFQLA